MEFEGLSDAWTVWSVESTKAVLVFRPEVFDSRALPAECVPTIYVTKGLRSRRPGRDVPDPEEPWYVTLSLEPSVSFDRRRFEDREAAVSGAKALAAAFAGGDLDYREPYQVPRPEYFQKLDELTGSG